MTLSEGQPNISSYTRSTWVDCRPLFSRTPWTLHKTNESYFGFHECYRRYRNTLDRIREDTRGEDDYKDNKKDEIGVNRGMTQSLFRP